MFLLRASCDALVVVRVDEISTRFISRLGDPSGSATLLRTRVLIVLADEMLTHLSVPIS
jgi:hypothetical protein